MPREVLPFFRSAFEQRLGVSGIHLDEHGGAAGYLKQAGGAWRLSDEDFLTLLQRAVDELTVKTIMER